MVSAAGTLLLMGVSLAAPLTAAAAPRVFLCRTLGGSCGCVPDQPHDYYVVHALSNAVGTSLDVCLRTDENESSPAVSVCEVGGGAGDELCAFQIVIDGGSAIEIQSFSAGGTPAGIDGLLTSSGMLNSLVFNWVDTASPTGTGGGAGEKIFIGNIVLNVDSTGIGHLSVGVDSEAVDADFDPVDLAIDSGTIAVPVPEPGAGWMLFVGLLALGWLAGARRASGLGAGLVLGMLFAPLADADLIEGASLLNPVELGISASEAADRSLAPIGDVNGDGVEDLAVGLPAADRGKGALLIAMMRRDGSVLRIRRIAEKAGIDPNLMGATAGLGTAVTHLGDLDGPSGPARTVLAVAAPGDNRVWIFYLGPPNQGHGVDLMSHTHLNLGYPVRALAPLGDLEGNGSFYLAVGIPDSTSGCPNQNSGRCGAVGLLRLQPDGTSDAAIFLNPGNPALPAFATNERFGASLAAVGDINGDGAPDLVAGTPGHGDSGGLLLLALAADGTLVSASRFSEANLGLPNSLGAGADLGASMTPIPDDGGPTAVGVMVGAPFAVGPNGTPAGAVLVLLGEGEGSLGLLTAIDAFSNEFAQGFGAGTEVGRSLALVDV
nr:integrin alpha [Myxococcota bacterium]